MPIAFHLLECAYIVHDTMRNYTHTQCLWKYIVIQADSVEILQRSIFQCSIIMHVWNNAIGFRD